MFTILPSWCTFSPHILLDNRSILPIGCLLLNGALCLCMSRGPRHSKLNPTCLEFLVSAFQRAKHSVLIRSQVSIWYGAVLRGDLNNIRVGAYSNIQDKSIIHAARSALLLFPYILPSSTHMCAILSCILDLFRDKRSLVVSGPLPQDCPQQQKLAGMSQLGRGACCDQQLWRTSVSSATGAS